MRMIQMDTWRPEAGTALRWQPTSESAAAAASTLAHDGPITFLTENHVRGSMAAAADGVRHRAFIGTATDVDGDLDADAMTWALTVFVRRHGALRMWFGKSGEAIDTHVVDAAAVEFEIADDGHLVPGPPTTAYLLRRFEQETPSTSFPGFAFGAIMRRGSFSIYLACDHGLTDGVSQALALDELLGIYGGLCAVPPDERRDAAQATDAGADYFDYAELESAATAVHAGGSTQTGTWVDIFSRHGFRMPRFSLDLGLAPGETAPVRPFRLHVLDGSEIEAFTKVCLDAGGKMIDGIYAAVAATDHELAGVERYFGMTVLNTRAASPEFATAQGWFCAFAPVEFPVSGTSSVRELIVAARAGRTRARDLGAVPTAAALAALVAAGLTANEVMTAPNLLSYIDFRWFPGNRTPTYERAVMFTGEGRTANASMWINCDNDELYIGSQTPDTPLAQARVHRYFTRLRDIIRSVALEGDHVIDGDHVQTAATAAVSGNR